MPSFVSFAPDVLGTCCQRTFLRRPRSTVISDAFGKMAYGTKIWLTLLMQTREQASKEASPTAGVVDSQSVNTTESGGLRGYDAGKKINGRKRHLSRTPSVFRSIWWSMPPTSKIVMGWPRHVAGSNVSSLGFAVSLPTPAIKALSLQTMQPAQASGLRSLQKRPPHADGFEIIPIHWVIERTLGWLGRNCRLAKDFERLIETSTAMAVVAIIQLLIRRLANG